MAPSWRAGRCSSCRRAPSRWWSRRTVSLTLSQEEHMADPAGNLEDVAAQLADVRRRLAAAEAVLAIQALKARYGALVDERFAQGSVIEGGALTRLAERVADLFTEDGVWDGGPGLGVVTGRTAIA